MNSTDKLSKLWGDRNSSHNWQLWFYVYLIKDELGSESFEMGHYTLKEKKLYIPLKSKKISVHTPSELFEFETILKEIIDDMVDPKVPFTQTDKLKHCEYCEFKNFCERQGTN